MVLWRQKGRGEDRKLTILTATSTAIEDIQNTSVYTVGGWKNCPKINENRDDIFICDCCACVCVTVYWLCALSEHLHHMSHPQPCENHEEIAHRGMRAKKPPGPVKGSQPLSRPDPEPQVPIGHRFSEGDPQHTGEAQTLPLMGERDPHHNDPAHQPPDRSIFPEYISGIYFGGRSAVQLTGVTNNGPIPYRALLEIHNSK